MLKRRSREIYNISSLWLFPLSIRPRIITRKYLAGISQEIICRSFGMASSWKIKPDRNRVGRRVAIIAISIADCCVDTIVDMSMPKESPVRQ